MRLTLVIRAINNQSLEALKKVINQAIAEAPQHLDRLKNNQRKIVYEKIEHLNKWYTKVIGLDEVKIYQERVTALQDQLLATQSQRREINKQLTEVRQQAQEIQSQIQHIDRKEKFDVYCQLINEEREILNLERSVTATFQQYDQAERDLFTAFTNAIRDSQEKQRSQLEYSKYIFLVLSIIGSFLAFIYTFFWRQDLKIYIDGKIGSLKVDLGNEMSQMINENRNELLNYLVKRINTTLDKPTDVHSTEARESSVKIVLSFVGIGLVGYAIGKLIIG